VNITEQLKLARAPIIEAVVDIDCTMPPGFDLAALEKSAREAFRDIYPKLRQQFVQEHQFRISTDSPPKTSVRHEIQAFQFRQEDEKQLVQIRAQGYSFNRLAPYGSLDDYLPEIERTWNLFRFLTLPTQVRAVRLRYINRLDLPMRDGKVNVADYFKDAPRIPADTNLSIGGFLNQRFAVEAETAHEANIVLSSQPPERDKLPVIFDISVGASGTEQPENWTWISGKIISLRALKNRIFKSTLTDQCLNLFQRSDSAALQVSQS
jgi:uncharacterized protein (TIGR04255 family)